MLKRLELFEYETLHVDAEYGVGEGKFVFGERDFRALVRLNDAHDGKIFKVGDRRLTTTSYVGYIEAGNLSVEILPKADRGRTHAGAPAWRDGLLKMLAIASDLQLDVTTDAAQRTKRSSLLEMVAERFVGEVERLLHEGLAKGYRETEANGATFRGRLAFTQHVRENAARADRFYVRYGTYDRDIVVNRILSLALGALGELTLAADVMARAKACELAFPEVADARVTPAPFERLHLGRTTTRYGRALTLARMILEQRAPELRAGRSRVFALVFDMNVLWERYISALFRRAVGRDLEVSTQERKHFWTADGYPSRKVRPDIVVRRRGDHRVVLVADTKWKVIGDGPPGDGDLKQMFVYNELLDAPTALLLYPAARASSGRRGRFAVRAGSSLAAHWCETVHLGLLDGVAWSDAGLTAQISDLLGKATAPTPESRATAREPA